MLSSRGQRMLHSSRYKRGEAKFSSMDDARVLRAIQKRQEQRDRRGESHLRFRALSTAVEDDGFTNATPTPGVFLKHATPGPRSYLKRATPAPGSYLNRATHALEGQENKQERILRCRPTKKELEDLGKRRYQNMLVWRERRRRHLEQQKHAQRPNFHAGQYQPDPPKFLSGQDVDPTTGRATPLRPAPSSLKKGTPSFSHLGQALSKGVAKPLRFHSGVTPQPSLGRAPASAQTKDAVVARAVRATPCRRPLGTLFRPPPGLCLNPSPARPSVLDCHPKPASITHSFGISEFTFQAHIDEMLPDFGLSKENSKATSPQSKEAPSSLDTSFSVAFPAVSTEPVSTSGTPPSPPRLRPRTPCSRSTRRSKLAHCDHTRTPVLPPSKRKGRSRRNTKGASAEVGDTPLPASGEEEEEGWVARLDACPWITRSRGSSGKRRREAGGPASAPWTDLDDIAMIRAHDASPMLRKNEAHAKMAILEDSVLPNPDALVWGSPASADQDPPSPALAPHDPTSPPSATQDPPSLASATQEPSSSAAATQAMSAVLLRDEAQAQMVFLTRPTVAPLPPTPDPSVWGPSPPSRASPATPAADEPSSQAPPIWHDPPMEAPPIRHPPFPRGKTRSSVSFAEPDPCVQGDFTRTKFRVTPVRPPSRKSGVSSRVSLLPGLYPTHSSCAEDLPARIDEDADLISWESPAIASKKPPKNAAVLALTPLRRSTRLSRTGCR